MAYDDDLTALTVQPVTAADAGIDPGAAGALGAQRGLLLLVQSRLMADKIATAKQQWAREQAVREQAAANETRRLDLDAARQAAVEARTTRALDDAENQRTLGQITARPGVKISDAQLTKLGIGADNPLRGTVFRAASPEELFGSGSRTLAGYAGMPGSETATRGAMNVTSRPTINPGDYTVAPTFSDELKQEATDLAQQKADIMRALGEAKNENERLHWQNMLDVANQRIAAAQDRAAAADARRNTLTPSQTLDEITKLNKAFNANTKGERQVMQNYAQIRSALKSLDDPTVNPTAATKATIDAFERTLNPMGVVRQTAFQQDVGHQNLLDTLWGKFQQNFGPGGHGMTPQNLKAFAAQVEPLARAAQQKIDREKTRITNMATPYGLPIDQIFADDDNPFAAGAPGAGAAGATGTTPRKYDIVSVK